jgi:DNA-binding phage protein
MDAEDFRTRMASALSKANADRVAMFLSQVTEEFAIDRVRRAVEAVADMSEVDRVARYGGLASVMLLQAMEVIDDERFNLPPAERVIFEGIAENAPLLAQVGVDGIATLERRLAASLLQVEHPPTNDPVEILNRIRFWTLVSLARGTVADDQHTGAEGAIAIYMNDAWDLNAF